MKLVQPSYWKDINLISLILYPISLITNLINFFKIFQKKKKI